MIKEKRFYNSLKGIFEGAKMDGQGGFVNLLKIKEKYYNSVIEQFKKEVDQNPIINEGFKEEFFDKLCNFFDKYFSESGSIYFVQSANWQKVYEKIYTDNKDVVLFWKTNMLYYVKSDKILNSSDIKIEDKESGLSYVFRFDTTQATQKQNNEKKGFLYTAKEAVKTKTALHDSTSGDSTFVLSVGYESKSKTKTEEIAKTFSLNEEIIKKAIRQFEKQTSVDFFINKNAQQFLNEQLDLYLHQILLADENVFDQSRLIQIKTIKEYAKKLISFIGGFEDELVRIWNKPKFVLNSNYVISKDKLTTDLISKLKASTGFDDQIKEWKKLKLVDSNFSAGNLDDDKYKHLPFDTKYFKDLEIEILSVFDNLDDALDGRLIHSENYQALQALEKKFFEKINCVYIDPPFNTGKDFEYVDAYQDSSWLSIMRDRLEFSRKYLHESGAIFMHLDRYANYYARTLLNDIFGKENYKAELYWDTCGNTGFKTSKNNWYQNTNCILQYAKENDKHQFFKQYTLLNVEDPTIAKTERKQKNIGWLDLQIDPEDEKLKDKHRAYVEQYENGTLVKKYHEFESKVDPIGMIWTDILSFLYTQVGNNESYFFNGGQKPEHLIARIIQSQTRPKQYVLDFYSGSGTTCAVAHKLNRKYLGFEMGNHFYTFYNSFDAELKKDVEKVGLIGRFKNVINGDSSFFAKKDDEYSPRKPQLTRNLNWQGGGFIKYYDMEQYEDSLRNSKYESSNNMSIFEESIYQHYTFFADKKLTSQFNVENNGDIKIELDKLYENIDLPETISNIMGLPIKTITKDTVVLLDGEKEVVEKYDYQNMTNEEKLHFFEILKPLLWWGE